VSLSNQVHIPVVFNTPVVPSVPKDFSHPPPLQVYNHHQTSHFPFDDSLLVSALPPPPAPIVKLDLPIATRKGICYTRNPSPYYTTLSYHRLSQPFYTFLSSISFVSIPKTVGDVLSHPSWCQAMFDKISSLQNSGTWELTPLPSEKSVVGLDEFLLLKLVLMALLIVSKLILCLKVIHKFLV